MLLRFLSSGYKEIFKYSRECSVVGQMAPGCSVLESNIHTSFLITVRENLEDSRLVDKERAGAHCDLRLWDMEECMLQNESLGPILGR